MKQITALEFEKTVFENPAWAASLTEPVAIVGHCRLTQSPITHLSPLLHFLGDDDMERAAKFFLCDQLKIAEGAFHGHVEFESCGVEKIGELSVPHRTNTCTIASFAGCKLKVAEGTFPGHVNFSRSCIERIGELHITQPSWLGMAADFSYCPRLQVATGTYPGEVTFAKSGIRAVRHLSARRANFRDCDILEEVPHEFLDNPAMVLDPKNEMRLREIMARRVAAMKAMRRGGNIEL